MSTLAILKCIGTKADGDIFCPVAEWEDDNGWTKIDDDYRKKKYINTGFVFHYQHKYEKNTLVLAKVDRDEEHFNPENQTHLLYQVKLDFPPKFFCEIIDQTLDEYNLPEKISLGSHSNWNSKDVYFKISEEFIVGPFETKKEGNKWYAHAQPEDEIFLNVYSLEDVYDSKYCFKPDHFTAYFLTEELPLSDKIVLSNIELVRRFLKFLQKLGKLSRKERQRIAEYFEQDFDLSQFIKQAFPNFKANPGRIINRLRRIFNEIELTESMINEIAEFLKGTPKVIEEIEKFKEEQLEEYIYQKKEEISEELAKAKVKSDEILKKEKQKFNMIREQIEKEKEKRNALVELNEKKRQELSDYIEKGEKWKNAMSSNHQIYVIEDEIPALFTGDEDTEIVDNYSNFLALLESSNFDKDDVLSIKQTVCKMIEKRLFQIHDFKDLSRIEDFWDFLGHQNGRFLIYADASWLTPKSLWNQRGNLSAFGKPISLIELFKIAEKAEEELIFQVEILGANRAPIEGYLGPLLKAIEGKGGFVVENTIVRVPENIVFFLQLDSDEYTAKPSEWLSNKLFYLSEVPSLEKLPNKVAVPLHILRENE